MGGWTLWMVDIYICTKAINALWVDSWPRPKSNGREKFIWGGECQVHRPLFSGRPSGLGIQGNCQVYRPHFTDPSLQMPSLPISLYRSLPKKLFETVKIFLIVETNFLAVSRMGVSIKTRSRPPCLKRAMLFSEFLKLLLHFHFAIWKLPYFWIFRSFLFWRFSFYKYKQNNFFFQIHWNS